MSEKDLENDEFQDDGFVPEHLRYIDEKEALEHKKQNLGYEETLENTLENDPELLNQINISSSCVDNQTNFPPIFYRSRFTCKVAEHFICKICSNVVKNPVECISCENLLCKECASATPKCPFGCDTFKHKSIAKFAANMYFALTLECKNKPFGCSYSGNIKNVISHEDNYQFVVTQCENSLCDRFILKKDKTREPGTPLLCSEICENLIKFSLMIDEENKFDTLQNFMALTERCKKLIEYEVKAQMQSKYKKIEESKRETESLRKRKEKVEKDLNSWQNAQHPGKWNIRTNKWTCCGSQEIIMIGCKQLA
ncbi:hypothetical protein SteCoe_25786 [Stentor coeruleus]|uniref:RING-type domain-containing protein n=1 Tax=Stentor coeruleus TaxID=5963 RepID=A0A1R2BEB6_9CILI|nr:hypothetical protein SteCoe_25786 [Stentor coeruleus]